ncbi:hypothetical protein D0Y65_034815 [Glycine soja]|uniref:Uncharacterized protein n=1 Tax=Glycine soja TaxID=3848 RepID=A0A445HSA3_GLYSO|nr:hypothetical protein D0Y65_034815 [Glycine soja]
MNHFFRKVPGRGFPGVFRKKCSSGRRLVTSGRTLLPETFRKRFFRKTPSSAFCAIFSGVLSSSPLSSSTLRVGRETNLFAEKKKKTLPWARLVEKKEVHEEDKKNEPGQNGSFNNLLGAPAILLGAPSFSLLLSACKPENSAGFGNPVQHKPEPPNPLISVLSSRRRPPRLWCLDSRTRHRSSHCTELFLRRAAALVASGGFPRRSTPFSGLRNFVFQGLVFIRKKYAS